MDVVPSFIAGQNIEKLGHTIMRPHECKVGPRGASIFSPRKARVFVEIFTLHAEMLARICVSVSVRLGASI
jgi:hypothetical protein